MTDYKIFFLAFLLGISGVADAEQVRLIDDYSSELRLLPAGCYKKTGDKAITERCVKQWDEIKKKKIECEDELQGMLVRDDARRKVICVKKQLR